MIQGLISIMLQSWESNCKVKNQAVKALKIDPKHFNSLYKKQSYFDKILQLKVQVSLTNITKPLYGQIKLCRLIQSIAIPYQLKVLIFQKFIDISLQFNILVLIQKMLKIMKKPQLQLINPFKQIPIIQFHYGKNFRKFSIYLGKLLQEQNYYQQALMYYGKALKLKKNHQRPKDRKNRYLDALKKK
ncbi:unnamed protein product [Paramecium pentaurelia]|uniref:Tetratricopeptide repeat protein n=1 Tax=Paramecium pentaurelia TaxID=43138 RepID=A0A8S1VFW8_9CILI|nr:unnamed protein product [Paramecium pentaurelia]